ncbi:MAG: hypothetical protein ABJD97_14460 [Betaproteobacteria bacterium]
MQTVPIPALAQNDPANRIICPEGCAVWADNAGRPWKIYSGGIGSCVGCMIYEFNSPAPQIYFFHFLASSNPLYNDFAANLPARVAGNMALFRVRLYTNPLVRTLASTNRRGQIAGTLAGAASVVNVDTAGGFSVDFSTGTFIDGGVVGGPGMGRLNNLGFPMTQFTCMSNIGGVAVAKTLPAGW